MTEQMTKITDALYVNIGPHFDLKKQDQNNI